MVIKSMKYEEILKLLTDNGVDSYDAMVATSCDEAWKELDEVALEITYDDFCSCCESCWQDCWDDTGLTAIADKVASYTIIHKRLPDNYAEIYDDDYEEEYEEESEDEEN